MMCSSVTLTGNVKTGEACVLHPMVKLCAAEDGEEVVIGDRTVIEEMSCITNSVVGQDNLVEVGSELRNCNIGNCNKIGPKCCISDSSVGNGCILSPGVRLFKAAIPDNVSVFVIDGAWRSHPIDNSSVVSVTEAYRTSLLDPTSSQCMSKYHSAHNGLCSSISTQEL